MPIACNAVIFDLDGTLVDTLDDLTDTCNAALESMNFPPHPASAHKFFVGDSIDTHLKRAAPEGTDQATLDELVERMKKEYSRHWARKSKPYPGIPALLRELEARKIPLAVLSNKLDAFTHEVVAHFFPGTEFAAVVGAPVGGKAKPDPALALQIAAGLGFSPDSICFMGDTRTDMDTAVNAGMFPVGVLWGFRPESELLEHGAKLILRRPSDFFQYI